MGNWKIADKVRVDLAKALLSGRKPCYIAEKKISRRQTSFWLLFDGFEFDTRRNEVRLLYRGNVMATYDVPPLEKGDTLTVTGSVEGRTTVTLTST